MLDNCNQRNDEHCDDDKTADKHRNAKSLDGGREGLLISGTPRESEYEQTRDQRRDQQTEEKPTEAKAAPLGSRNPDDDGQGQPSEEYRHASSPVSDQ